jgi:transposase-like protein
MARRKGTARRYTTAQRREILRLVNTGETQVAVAAKTGVPLATVSYWARKAKGGAANGTARSKGKRGRPVGSRNRAVAVSSRSSEIAWALDGDTLVIRIPLRVFARKIAEEALAKI